MLSGYWNGGAGASIEILAELMGTPKSPSTITDREWGIALPRATWAAFGIAIPPNKMQKNRSPSNS